MTELRTELPVSPTAPALARQALDGWLTALVGQEAAEDVRAITTELVANAVTHGGLGQDDRIVLWGIVEDVVRIEIEQPSPVTGAKVLVGGDLTETGLGLRIVDKVATRWGVVEGPPGVVWFEVEKE